MDNINLTSTANNTEFKLLTGKISISGKARMLEFRDRYFHQPLTVILKEGNFTLLTGLLMALFTFYLTRLYSQFKK